MLMCRWNAADLEFFLVHPGGPFFTNKETGVWSIPKGFPEGDEDLLITAQREFTEETGLSPQPPFEPLGSIRQKGGKLVHAWTFIGSWNPQEGIKCNTFQLEWPPRSGKRREFPEVDKARWANYETASTLIIAEQLPLLEKAKDIHTSIHDNTENF